MPLALIVATVVLAHTAFNGSRLTISLSALSTGATPLTVGVLMSLIAVLPMLLGIYSGRLVDRIGVRRPLIGSLVLLVVSVVLPGLAPGLASLHIAAVGAGTSFMMFHIAVQHMVGEMSTDANRRDNFGWLAVGFAISNFVGPTVAGISIDNLGHRATFCVLAVFATAALAVLAVRRDALPHSPDAPAHPGDRNAMELLRNRKLRHVFIASGLLASAWDLFGFVMPIYGTSIGLTATTIGIILGAFAAATFLVRLALPWISRHVREWPLIMIACAVGAVAFLAFPLVTTVPLLMAISFLLGLGLGSTQPSIMALVYSTAPPGRAAEAVGVRTVVLNASSTLLPLLFGGLGSVLGMVPVFWTMGAALFGGSWFAARRRRGLS